jgi:hypothetical protein
MSEHMTLERPSDTSKQPAPGARTMLEAIADARRTSGPAEPPAEAPSQVSVRETNPNAATGPAGQGDQHQARRVQQDPNTPAEGDSAAPAQAMDILGQKLFGKDRWDARKGKLASKEAEPATPPPAPAPAAKPPEAPQQPAKSPIVTKTKGVQLTKESLQSIIESATKAAVTAVTPQSTAVTQASPGADPDLEAMAPREKTRLEVVKQMAQKDPVYADLPKKFVLFARSKREYELEWKKENPGERFNWADEQHREWLDSNSPEAEYENFAEDFDDSRIELRAAAIAREQVSKAQESIESLRAQTVEASLRDQVKQESAAVLKNWGEHFAPNSKWDLTTEEGRRAAMEQDKISGPIAAQWASELAAVTTEIVRIFDSKGTIKVDMDNPYHRYLVNLSEVAEERLSAEEPENTRNAKGQTFLPRHEYRALPADKRAKHYTLLRNELIALTEADILHKANSDRETELNKLETLAKEYGWRFDRDAFTTQKSQPPAKAPTRTETPALQPPPRQDATPPASTSGREAALQQNQTAITNKEFSGMLMSKLFPRDKSE